MISLEPALQTLIIIHAALGGIALVSGAMALAVKKGHTTHRKAGKLFVWTMTTAAGVAIIIAVSPGHQNPFLFAIGVFSSYLALSGLRALRFKKHKPDYLDRILSLIMLTISICMIVGPVVYVSTINIVLSVFGIIGGSFAVRDLILFKQPEKLRKNWLVLHLGKTTGAYISAFTAFVVVNQFIPGLWGWLSPTVLGTAFIVYWSRKVSNKKKSKDNLEI
jgi:uncharacterized membrane protein HdeD (DUF308 family)